MPRWRAMLNPTTTGAAGQGSRGTPGATAHLAQRSRAGGRRAVLTADDAHLLGLRLPAIRTTLGRPGAAMSEKKRSGA
ncbi:MAG: hypothetical protein IID44_13655 [Planctomycetes bacterium]|nr:hypothetical protein [Planctomycetota bacterium]